MAIGDKADMEITRNLWNDGDKIQTCWDLSGDSSPATLQGGGDWAQAAALFALAEAVTKAADKIAKAIMASKR